MSDKIITTRYIPIKLYLAIDWEDGSQRTPEEYGFGDQKTNESDLTYVLESQAIPREAVEALIDGSMCDAEIVTKLQALLKDGIWEEAEASTYTQYTRSDITIPREAVEALIGKLEEKISELSGAAESSRPVGFQTIQKRIDRLFTEKGALEALLKGGTK